MLVDTASSQLVGASLELVRPAERRGRVVAPVNVVVVQEGFLVVVGRLSTGSGGSGGRHGRSRLRGGSTTTVTAALGPSGGPARSPGGGQDIINDITTVVRAGRRGGRRGRGSLRLGLGSGGRLLLLLLLLLLLSLLLLLLFLLLLLLLLLLLGSGRLGLGLSLDESGGRGKREGGSFNRGRTASLLHGRPSGRGRQLGGGGFSHGLEGPFGFNSTLVVLQFKRRTVNTGSADGGTQQD